LETKITYFEDTVYSHSNKMKKKTQTNKQTNTKNTNKNKRAQDIGKKNIS
jgi:hypothetical protein